MTKPIAAIRDEIRLPAPFTMPVLGQVFTVIRKRFAKKQHQAAIDFNLMRVELRLSYPTIWDELVSNSHERNHAAAAILDIPLRDDGEHDDADMLAHVEIQVLRALMEQGIFAWGPAMVRDEPPEAPGQGRK